MMIIIVHKKLKLYIFNGTAENKKERTLMKILFAVYVSLILI